MHAETFLRRHPLLFHAAEAGAWPSIRARGLLSTSALLDLFEMRGERRAAIESARRPERVELRHPRHGRAWIRDNRPLRDDILARCLVGMSPREWYEALNGKVFFWASAERLERLLRARAHRDRAHDILVVDARLLLARHARRLTVTTINSGAALFPSAPSRGRFTFKRLADVPPSETVVEVAVEGAVRDIGSLVQSVERRETSPGPASNARCA